MATFGPNDLKQYMLPSGWDAGEITKFQLRDGTTYEALIADIATGLAIVNRELMTMPIIGGLISETDEMAVEYGIGVSNGMQVHTEYSLPNPQRGGTTGHMLPLTAYDNATGWTFDMLRAARRIQIDQDLRTLFKDVRDNWAKKCLQRLFKSTKEAVGSTGYTYPLADGGTADSSYIPPHMPDRESSAFAYTHDHVEDLNGISQANLETAVKHIWEHGADGPFELLVSLADLSSWTDVTALTGYVPPANALVRYGVTQDLAAVQDSLGVINTDYGAVVLRATGRIPTGYWTVYKSYGINDPRNVMKVRVSPDYGANAILLAGDHIRKYPLENALLFHEFGFGIADRVGAIVVQSTAGSYSDPTIS